MIKSTSKIGCFYFLIRPICFLGWRTRIGNQFLGVSIEKTIFCRFSIESQGRLPALTESSPIIFESSPDWQENGSSRCTTTVGGVDGCYCHGDQALSSPSWRRPNHLRNWEATVLLRCWQPLARSWRGWLQIGWLGGWRKEGKLANPKQNLEKGGWWLTSAWGAPKGSAMDFSYSHRWPERTAPNQPIMFGNGSLSNTTSIARAFCKQFTGCSPRRTCASRRLWRLIKRRPLDHSLLLFTPVQVREAMMASGNSTAHGPDHLNILHLKHLGPTGIFYLCSLFNLSLALADISSIWKQAIIIALLKAGKPASLGTSYCPISLVSPTGKILERLLLPILNEHLHTVPIQHGRSGPPLLWNGPPLLPYFRLPTPYPRALIKGSPSRRTVSLAIDFSKAFDTVSHDLLLECLMETTLPSISCYLHGRSASCQYRQARSGFRSVGAGVPQGSVISPCLFNFFVSDYPHTADLHSSYADDFTAVVFDHNIHAASQRMSDHAADALQWAADHGLQVSVNKSNCTLFTSDTHQSRLDPSVSCNGNTFPLCRSPKLLGVTFDTHFTFSPHIRGVAERACSCLGRVELGTVQGGSPAHLPDVN